MKHRIIDGLQVAAAILVTSGLLASAAPLPVDNQQAAKSKPPKIKVEKPSDAPAAPVAAVSAPVAIVTTPAPTAVSEPPSVSVTTDLPVGDHTDWMAAAGIAPSDYGYVTYIVDREGHWDPCVRFGGISDCTYATSGGTLAYGVCQSNPGQKMATAGDDWATNPITQLKWCSTHAAGFGGWYGAYLYWVANHNW